MAKTLIGNIKGKDGRGIASIIKTGTAGSVDTYTITYTDGTKSTFTINNSDSISLQRQIVPSAAVESSATASQAYAAGQYVVVNGVLRKVKSAIAKGNAISDSNSTATTVTGEIAAVAGSGSNVSKNGDWYVIKVGNGAKMLSLHNQMTVTNFEKREYIYNHDLPEGCGTPISGFVNVSQWRASNPRVVFPSNNKVQITIPIKESTSDGTASDPYYIPFDLAVICVN